MNTPAKPPLEERNPWPMTWVAVSIAVFIVGYTFVNIAYRKPEPAHEPWREAQDRRERFVSESLMAWTRLRVDLTAPDDTAPTSAIPSAEVTTAPTPARLEDVVPKDLAIIMPERPTLRPAPWQIESPRELEAADAYRLRLNFVDDANAAGGDIGEILAYTKDHRLHVFLQAVDNLPADLAATPVSARMDLTLPAGLLGAGSWEGTLYAADLMFDWRFTVH